MRRPLRTRVRTAILLLLLLLSGGVSAQDALKEYLQATDQFRARHQEQVEAFLATIAPHRQSNDVAALKSETDRYIATWTGMLDELSAVQPPEGARDYHQALLRTLEVERETSQLLSDILGDRLLLLNELELMREDGASAQEMEAYVDANAPNQDDVTERTAGLRAESRELKATVKAERARLGELVGEP